MKIAKQSKINERGNPLSMIHALDNDVERLFQLIQGRVRFGDGSDGARGENIAGEFQVVADTGTANTEFSVTHTLGSVPVGYLVVKNSVSGNIYLGTTSWTDTTIYLKHSGANSAITLFLLK